MEFLIFDGEEPYDDGVNAAAGLEAVAPPSGILRSPTFREVR